MPKCEKSRFFCTNCGKENVMIPRNHGQRAATHLKKLYCPWCREEHNHAEVRDGTKYTCADFKFEYASGNFTSGGLRKIPYQQLKHNYIYY